MDAGTPDQLSAVDSSTCLLPTALTSYYDGDHAPATTSVGGNDLYQDVNQLDRSGTLTITRTWNDGSVRSCTPALPACGTPGAVTVATIASELAAIDVQAAFAVSPMSIYGLDDRLQGGAVYAIARDDLRILYVGSPCTSMSSSSCQPVPSGVQRLSDGLKSLVSTALGDPACSGL